MKLSLPSLPVNLVVCRTLKASSPMTSAVPCSLDICQPFSLSQFYFCFCFVQAQPNN